MSPLVLESNAASVAPWLSGCPTGQCCLFLNMEHVVFILDSFFEFDWDQTIILRCSLKGEGGWKGFGKGGFGEDAHWSGLEEPIQKSAT